MQEHSPASSGMDPADGDWTSRTRWSIQGAGFSDIYAWKGKTIVMFTNVMEIWIKMVIEKLLAKHFFYSKIQ